MKLLSHLKLCVGMIFAGSLPAMYAVAVEPSPTHLVFASDPKFPSSEKSDSREDESAADTETRSRWLIDAQYSSIADFRTQSGGAAAVPVMINGNLTAFGRDSERSYIKAVLQNKLGNVYDYGLGNHDYDFNVATCSDCAAGSVDDLDTGEKCRTWTSLPGRQASRKPGTEAWRTPGILAMST
ncbi:hypothetical protein [Pseudomonas fluorescens]|uniref:hypothetical protein n=1 Tax=Pseudomonas fluorescens TaxID=294 RepID=UPI0020A08E5A|nr:hypothetical protein [Pseudomonas fluorescens]